MQAPPGSAERLCVFWNLTVFFFYVKRMSFYVSHKQIKCYYSWLELKAMSMFNLSIESVHFSRLNSVRKPVIISTFIKATIQCMSFPLFTTTQTIRIDNYNLQNVLIINYSNFRNSYIKFTYIYIYIRMHYAFKTRINFALSWTLAALKTKNKNDKNNTARKKKITRQATARRKKRSDSKRGTHKELARISDGSWMGEKWTAAHTLWQNDLWLIVNRNYMFAALHRIESRSDLFLIFISHLIVEHTAFDFG